LVGVCLGYFMLVPLTASAESPAGQQVVSRGEYLVHRVAMCVQCHSPRTERGKLIDSKLLQGGRIPSGPLYANQAWATTAPRLAGLPGYDTQEIVELLTKGRRPTSNPPRSPMPPFRLERADAKAIVTYLKSLKP
jgi:mono/diheme cytochrome c family protein